MQYDVSRTGKEVLMSFLTPIKNIYQAFSIKKEIYHISQQVTLRTKDGLEKSKKCVFFPVVSEVIIPPTLGYLHRCKIGIDSLQ